MTKITLLTLLILTLCSLVACGQMTDEDKTVIADLAKENVEQVKIIAELKTKYERGELGEDDLKKAIDIAETLINKNLEITNGIKAKGVSTTEIILYSVGNALLAFFGRGLPSKGPFSFVRTLAGGSTRKD